MAQKMGHMSFDNLMKVRNKDVVRYMPKIIHPLEIVYKDCQQGKQTKVNFKINEYSTSKPFKLVHTC